MGNYRFRLSDMMPNAWFYKLKDMSKTKNPIKKNQSSSPTTTSQKSHLQRPSYSYYLATEADKFSYSPRNPKAIDTHFPDSPRKSPKRKSKRKTIYNPSPRRVSSCVSSAGCSGRSSFNSVWTQSHEDYFLSPSVETSPDPDFQEFESFESFDRLVSSSSSTSDIIIDMNKKSCTRKKLDSVSELDLPPILTKPAKLEQKQVRGSLSIRIVKEDSAKTKYSTTGIKLRNRKIRARNRVTSSSTSKYISESLSESFAIVKCSVDPERDFRDSMVEMIVENNISSSKDLEDLLACYLQLNSKEYHHLIVKAFEEIWFHMSGLM